MSELSTSRLWGWVRAVALLVISTHVVYASAAETETKDGALRTFLQQYLKGNDLTEDRTTRYSMAPVSLDDKTQMYLVYITAQGWCGSSGCIALLLEPYQSSFKVLEDFGPVRLPIRVLPPLTNGWHDITMWVQGGGIISGFNAVLRYDGSKYPGNPTDEPALQATESGGGELPLKLDGDLLYP